MTTRRHPILTYCKRLRRPCLSGPVLPLDSEPSPRLGPWLYPAD
jgi:hypothetical protein